MTELRKTQVPRYVTMSALALTALAFVLGGVTVGVGAVVGGTVAVLDAFAMVWLAERMLEGAAAMRGFAAVLLGVKLVAVLAICWALMARWGVDPIGFAVGLSAIVVGVLYAGIVYASSEMQTAGEG